MLEIFVYLLSLMASVVSEKPDDCTSFEALRTSPAWKDYTQLIESELQFTAELWRKISMRRSSDNLNVVFTPFNIYNSLLVMYFMSANRTEQTIGKIFHIPKNQTKNSIHAIYKTLTLYKRTRVDIKSIESQKNPKKMNKFDRKNFIREDFCIFLSNKFKVKSCAMKFFKDNIALVDFEKPEETVTKVNAWAWKHTGYTADSVQRTDFDDYTHMLFANTALFDANWEKPFEYNKIDQQFKTLHGSTVNVTLMGQTGMFKRWYDSDLEVDILELPYEGKIYKVLILLPRFESPTVMAHLLKSLSKQKLKEVINKYKEVKDSYVNVEIPKFQIEKTYDLIKTMRYLGFGELFDFPIDLSNILEKPNLRQTTKFRIKAVYTVKIKFDNNKTKVTSPEAGSSIGTNSSVLKLETGNPKPWVFRADHPFVYLIYTSTNMIVLNGVLYHP